jgi:hypothetical protein
MTVFKPLRLAVGRNRTETSGAWLSPICRTSSRFALLLPLLFVLPFLAPSVAQAECPNETLRAENNSTQLPDCRAYEQVSPIEKEGGTGGVSGVPGAAPAGRALANGEAITYGGDFFHPHGPLGEGYTSRRSPTGWTIENGDTLSPEPVPPAVLPTVAEGTGALVLEETASGSKVFFLDEAELIPGVSNAAENEPDLYEYDVVTGELTDLTIDASEHPDVQGILGIGGERTEEGSYVYFVAGGKLTPNAPAGTCGERGGKSSNSVGHQEGATGTGCKLYVRHNETTTFIATLEPKDESGVNGITVKNGSLFDWIVTSSERTAEVSPNGRYVTFGSRKNLTGQAAEPFAVINEDGTLLETIRGAEIFRYSAEAEEEHAQSIVCVSCVPDGVPKNSVPYASGAINGAGRSRYTLDNGRVIFTTSAALVPGDINHQPDLYEYQPEGVGSCTSSTSAAGSKFIPEELGCVSLISGGSGETNPDVAFADASATGSDVFFVTSQSLVPGDTDEIKDMYDAREGGGFPPLPAPACAHEAACRAGAPPSSGNASATSGTGAERPPPALNLETPAKPAPKPLTRAQKLAKALKQCHKQFAGKSKRTKRSACERSATAKYGPKHKSKARKATTNGRR